MTTVLEWAHARLALETVNSQLRTEELDAMCLYTVSDKRYDIELIACPRRHNMPPIANRRRAQL